MCFFCFGCQLCKQRSDVLSSLHSCHGNQLELCLGYQEHYESAKYNCASFYNMGIGGQHLLLKQF